MMEPVNHDVTDSELLVRNIYRTSQYSDSRGLKRNFLYPNYKKESRYYKGYHTCRVSLQRLCYGGWDNIKQCAENTKSMTQDLIGFSIARSEIIAQYGFQLEPAAHEGNPFHLHIYIPELDLPYPAPEDTLNGVMNSGIRRRLDELSEKFEMIKLEEINILNSRHYASNCLLCLTSNRD